MSTTCVVSTHDASSPEAKVVALPLPRNWHFHSDWRYVSARPRERHRVDVPVKTRPHAAQNLLPRGSGRPPNSLPRRTFSYRQQPIRWSGSRRNCGVDQVFVHVYEYVVWEPFSNTGIVGAASCSIRRIAMHTTVVTIPATKPMPKTMYAAIPRRGRTVRNLARQDSAKAGECSGNVSHSICPFPVTRTT